MLFLPFSIVGQNAPEPRVEPPFWWTGFKNTQLQLLIYYPEIGSCECTLKENRAGEVRLMRTETVESPNYLFVTLDLSGATTGTFEMVFKKEGKILLKVPYELKQRESGSASRKGFDASDVIYLLMPDRFANGDTTNDNPLWALEKTNRSNPDGRHGGDIKGILQNLDYFSTLGVTALWINPWLENNQARYSYHGYSTTNYYLTDPRLGTNEDIRTLSAGLKKRGIKLIMDQVFNHCGSGHWWMKDLPMNDWLNQWPEFTRSNYRGGSVSDPYVSAYDSARYVRGWFDVTMPDLNQHNRFLKTYLIQQSIWWIEFAGLDGIRQDTHPYPFKDMMADWGKAVQTEYPGFNIVGEVWVNYPSTVAYWQQGNHNHDGYNSWLPSVFDFPMQDALLKAFSEKESWNTGILRLYEILSQDFVFPDPSNIVTFADNHDVNRFLDTQQDDIRKLKMAVAFLLTTRGIPQLYYGTEILMTTGEDEGHGTIRRDFPGGWPGDTVNAFLRSNLSSSQSDMLHFTTTLLQWRKTSKAVCRGTLTHFIPEDGVYVYFRQYENETVMVVMNNNETEKSVQTDRYSEFLRMFRTGKEIISGEAIDDLSSLALPGKSVKIIELR